ncbi:septum formation initiator family protein [Aquamicrobium segne]|uniref:Septum formation initiator family protein n=1 Tax=Aquamicrobium segne TaxID=469547 RepID=A0ABW0GX78_9HYPH
MWTRQYKQRKTGRLIVPALCAAFVAYFSFHAYHGQYGINSHERMKEQAGFLQAQLDQLQAQRQELERRVRLLHDGSLEKDMLDELARKALNMSSPDEVIIMIR